MNDWHRLGLDGPTPDPAAIKRAYALRLRVTRPDDDPGAYQALREAYDRVLAWARTATDPAVADADTAPAPAADIPLAASGGRSAAADVPAMPDTTPAPATTGPSPAELCAVFVDTFRRQGGALVSASLPALMQALDALPLAARDEASVRFADAVIAHPALHDGVKVALRDHFGWTADFRVERLLGPVRLQALAAALPEVIVPETDPDVLGRFAELTALRALHRAGLGARARLAAFLLDARLRMQLQSLDMLVQLAGGGRLSLPGRRLLAALDWGPSDSRFARDLLKTSYGLHGAVAMALLILCLPFGVAELPLSFLVAGLLALGGFAATLVLGLAAGWAVRQRARFGTSESDLPAWVPRMDLYRAHRIGVWTMIGAAIAAPRLAGAFGAEALLLPLVALAVVGAVLAQPDDVGETLAIAGVVAFVVAVVNGASLDTAAALLGGAHGGASDPRTLLHEIGFVAVLFAWQFSGIRTYASGGYEATLRSQQIRWQLGAIFGLAIAAVPAAVGWATARCGFALVLVCVLLSTAAALRLQAVGAPAFATLAVLPVVVTAAYLCRRAAHAAGERVIATAVARGRR